MKKPKTAMDISKAMRKKMRRKTLAIYVKNFVPSIPMALGLVIISTLTAIWFELPYWVGLIIGLIIVAILTFWP